MKTISAKVVRFYETGDASVLRIEEQSLQTPGDGEVRIKAEAIGLNRAEVMFRNGAYLEQPKFPSKLGYEVSGVIDAVGENVSAFQKGDRVSTIPAFSMGQHGVYGEYPVVPASAVARYPESLSSAEGTAIWMQFITAYGALIDIGQLEAGQTVLITAASSSVGIAAIQIAKMIGAKCIATTRGSSKVESLLNLGADHVIQTESEAISEEVSRITGEQGANLVFDPIGGPIVQELASATAKGGMIIEYGALDDRETIYPLFEALGKGLSIIGYTLFEITQDPARLSRAIAFVTNGVDKGSLKPVIDREFAFDDIQAAHRYMEGNSQTGKIVVRV
ncbi:MAG: zinc-dependent alcohol dehydrogenase family protein [Candidatus Thiodiazotropha lotti]|nr:zinc-dependent alcohol dehydrogenase family protein [Candidatus Thiodiazotropha lotti]